MPLSDAIMEYQDVKMVKAPPAPDGNFNAGSHELLMRWTSLFGVSGVGGAEPSLLPIILGHLNALS